MYTPRVILADTDAAYIDKLQVKFITEYFDKIDLEIITDKAYFEDLFSKPQRVDILVVDQQLYDQSLSIHSIKNIFVLAENPGAVELSPEVVPIHKYSNIRAIFEEIVGRAAAFLNVDSVETREPQIILVTSATGGTGKTTLAMGVAACIQASYKRVLYINASRLQNFAYMLSNSGPITDNMIYGKLANASSNIYNEIKHVLRSEDFGYLPPFKAALMSMGVSFSVFGTIAQSAKASGDFDYIIIDAEATFDEDKTKLIDMANRIVVVTDQTRAAVEGLGGFCSNVAGAASDKFTFVCNRHDNTKENYLVKGEALGKYKVNDYISVFDDSSESLIEHLASNKEIQKLSYLLM